ncbi:MAG: antibiotic biosynthesis monooxygenase [Vulcanimicrobiota bacterium]
MPDKPAHFEGRMEVRQGRETEFALWQARYQETVASFSGLLSSEVVAPAADSQVWTTRLSFTGQSALADWLNSPAREQLLEEVAPLALSGMVTRFSTEATPELGVTEAFFTRLRPDKLREYQLWQTHIHQVQAKFLGYLGMVFQPPVKGQDEWVTLLRFDNTEHLEQWLASPQRRELLDELEDLVEEIRQCRVASSFPGWIPAAPSDAEQPANWKVTMLVVVGLFPLVMLQIKYVNPWLLDALPLAPGTMLANIGSAILISYLTMPVCIRLFGWWLYPADENTRTVSIRGTLAVLVVYLLEVLVFWA